MKYFYFYNAVSLCLASIHIDMESLRFVRIVRYELACFQKDRQHGRKTKSPPKYSRQ